MKIIFFTAMILTLSNCASSDKPNDLVSQEDMIGLQIDFQILDEQISALKVSKDSSRIIYAKYSDSIYAKYNILEKQYLESYEYYLNDRKNFLKIYEAVVDSLSLEERLSTPTEK